MNSKLKEILGTSIFYLAVILCTFLILKFVGQRTEVIGSSMMTTLEDGDNLILNKIAYRTGNPERFDIVIFPFRDNSRKNYIKRIIGLPGETVQIDEDGVIYIDGEVLEESYGREIIKRAGRAAGDGVTLGSDEYFVMGDNRNNSEDSRFEEVGLVKRSEFIGKSTFRIWPLSKFGKIE